VGDVNNDGRQDVVGEPENSWARYVFLNLPPLSKDTNNNQIPDECEGLGFFYYLTAFAAGNTAVADMTATAIQGQPGYGQPNGVLNNDDFFFYLAAFATGC
jgi:hypothetical protein